MTAEGTGGNDDMEVVMNDRENENKTEEVGTQPEPQFPKPKNREAVAFVGNASKAEKYDKDTLEILNFVDKIVDSYNDSSGDLVGTHIDDFVYQGFDQKVVLKKLKEKAGNLPIGEIMKDVVGMITLCLLRGTRFGSIEKRTATAGIEKLNRYRTVYGIVTTSKLTTVDVNALTLSRICNSFPYLTSVTMSDDRIQVKGEQPNGLVKELCWPGAPAIIPSTYHSTYQLWLDWAMTFDEVINANSQIRREIRRRSLITISQTAWKNNFIDDTTRIKYMKEFNQSEPQNSRKRNLQEFMSAGPNPYNQFDFNAPDPYVRAGPMGIGSMNMSMGEQLAMQGNNLSRP